MSKNLYLFTRLQPAALHELVELHRQDFDEFLRDHYTEEELGMLEKTLDDLAAITAQPMFEELSFEDLEPDPLNEDEQKLFFAHCRSTVCLENLPYLESHPFQVTYLKMLLNLFDEVLVDRGGFQPVLFKSQFLKELDKYKSIHLAPIAQCSESTPPKPTSKPVDPIDFVIQDVYREFERLRSKEDEETARLIVGESEKLQRLYHIMKGGELTSSDLFRVSGLNPKDFDDYLEKLKFWLRKFK